MRCLFFSHNRREWINYQTRVKGAHRSNTSRSKLVSLYTYIFKLFFFVLFRVASSPEQQGQYVRTWVLSSHPTITTRGYVDKDGSSGRRFAEKLQTDIQKTGNETAGLLDQVPGPGDVNHSLPACLWFF